MLIAYPDQECQHMGSAPRYVLERACRNLSSLRLHLISTERRYSAIRSTSRRFTDVPLLLEALLYSVIVLQLTILFTKAILELSS